MMVARTGNARGAVGLPELSVQAFASRRAWGSRGPADGALTGKRPATHRRGPELAPGSLIATWFLVLRDAPLHNRARWSRRRVHAVELTQTQGETSRAPGYRVGSRGTVQLVPAAGAVLTAAPLTPPANT